MTRLLSYIRLLFSTRPPFYDRLVFSIIFISIGVVNAAALPQLRLPLDGTPSLSANFGELRPNHFHSGLDFKTGGETGRRVMAVADGYVSAVEVSPWGYGRAVYVTHPSLGIVTVYGHLMAFAPEIDKVVRQAQYDGETFDIELSWGPDKFKVKAGDVIGLSGNAGSSGGPHLHFNVEDLATGDPLDPLPFFKSYIKDTEPPYYKAIYLYPDDRRGVVGGRYEPTSLGTDSEKVFTAWGRVIPAINCNDAMDGTSNIFGVKTIVLYVDGTPVFGRTIDRFPYSATRAINTLVDYDCLLGQGSWAQWSRVASTRPLSSLVGATLANGVININQERDYKCRYILQDEHGNQKRIDFTIRGRRPSKMPEYKPTGTLMRPGSFNTINLPGAVATIGRDALWDPTEVAFTAKTSDDAKLLTDIYTLSTNRRPFAGDVTLSFDLNKSLQAAKGLVAVRIGSNGGMAAVGGKVEDGKYVVKVGRPGRYALTTDTSAPTIEAVDTDRNSEGYLAWRVKDDLSGLDTYRVTIDGRYALAELDGKNNLVEFKMDQARFKRGATHTAVIRATDAVGNSRESTLTFTW